MSIVVENFSYYNSGAQNTGISFNHTPPSATNLLLAFLCARGGGAYISGMTCEQELGFGFDPLPFTLLATQQHSETFWLSVSIFFLLNPINSNLPINMAWTTSSRVIAGVYSLSDALVPVVGSVVGKGGTGSPLQETVTSARGDLVLTAASMEGTTEDTLSAIADQTQDWLERNATTVYGTAGYKAGEPSCVVGWNIGNRACMLGLNVPTATPPPSFFVPRIIFS